MRLTPYGREIWAPVTLVAVLVAIVLLALGWWWLLPVVALPWGFVAWFFRDPTRRIPTDLPEGAMLSSADGVVSAVLHLDEHPSVEGPAVLIRVFLSVLNVHVNRAPCRCVAVRTDYTPGKFLNAQTEASAVENENNLITLLRPNGETIGVKQIAGLIARRIVCPLAPGRRMERGEQFGMIRFGSTTELILPRPDDVEVKVRKGDVVRGGLTVLAVLAERRETSPADATAVVAEAAG